VFAFILGSRWRQDEHSPQYVYLSQAQSSNLLTTLPSEDQEPDYSAVIGVATGTPDRGEFGFG
jgi:hypothetical protein